MEWVSEFEEKKEQALAGLSDTSAMVDGAEGGRLWGGEESWYGRRRGQECGCYSERTPIFPTPDVTTSSTVPVVPVPLVKVEATQQEPDGPKETSQEISTQSDTVDVFPNPEGALLKQMQNVCNQDMATMNKIVQLIAITKSENSLMKSISKLMI